MVEMILEGKGQQLVFMLIVFLKPHVASGERMAVYLFFVMLLKTDE